MGTSFDAEWPPRIGLEAASALKRRQQLALFRLGFGVIFISLIAGLATSGWYWPVIGAAGAAGLAIYIVGTIRVNRRLAHALSIHLGFSIIPSRLPPLGSPERFDRWLRAVKAGVAPREHSFLRGFVKVKLPPK